MHEDSAESTHETRVQTHTHTLDTRAGLVRGTTKKKKKNEPQPVTRVSNTQQFHFLILFFDLFDLLMCFIICFQKITRVSTKK